MDLVYVQKVSISCKRCGNAGAVYRREYSGEVLCRRCFIETFTKRVIKTIAKYGLLRHDDRIAVAVSGGKDSLSLLHVLNKIEKDFPLSELFAITVDEGIEGYREEAIRYVTQLCRSIGIHVEVVSFKELYGFDLDHLVKEGVLNKLGLKPCSVCGPLRRKAINTAAKRLGATVIATAHTLDDVVQTYFLNALRGEKKQHNPGLRREAKSIIPRVAPFRLTPEREVILYAYLNRLPFQSYACPNAPKSMRNMLRRFLSEWEQNYVGSLFAAINYFDYIVKANNTSEYSYCDSCGEPSSGKLCRSCELVNKVIGIYHRLVK